MTEYKVLTSLRHWSKNQSEVFNFEGQRVVNHNPDTSQWRHCCRFFSVKCFNPLSLSLYAVRTFL